MPLFEYILLALLGSAGSAADGSLATPPGPALGADAFVQPNGGALSSSGRQGDKPADDKKTTRRLPGAQARTAHKTRHHRPKHHGRTTKPRPGKPSNTQK